MSMTSREVRLAKSDSALWSAATRLSDYFELTKPRIVLLELIVAAATACIAAPYAIDAGILFHALAATALVAGSASMGNQLLEREVDAKMPRTANRPLPAGRIAAWEAALLSMATLAAGLVWLCLKVNVLTALLGLASWIVYVAIYTPLKTRTPLNTAVGALAGAIPLLMGWTATGQPLSLTAFALAGVLFLWQFPHFMAIAWIYREDYRKAGHQMMSVVDPTGLRCGWQAILGALFLIPVSLIPAILPAGRSPMAYSLWAIALGGVVLALAIRFAYVRNDRTARQLLKSTLIYLPAWMGVLLMVSL